MLSPVDRDRHRELIDKIILLLLAVAFNALEFFIPRMPFFPWLKPGLANIITMIWIIRYGTADALVYSIIRTWIAGCYFGFSLVSLSLSLSGGLLSTIVMGLLWSMIGKRRLMGCIGIGVAGALFHNVGQLATVYALLTTNDRIFFQFPVMALASVAFGGGVGALVVPVMIMLDRRTDGLEAMRVSLPSQGEAVRPGETVATIALFALSFMLVFITSTAALGIIAGITALALLVMFEGSIAVPFRPLLRFWVLFLFIALVYLILPYGTRLEHFSFLTHESVTATAQQWLRLYTWLALSFVFTKYRFHVVLFALLARAFRRQEVTLSAGLFAFEFFPLVAAMGKNRGRGFFKNLIRHPVHSTEREIAILQGEIVSGLRNNSEKT